VVGAEAAARVAKQVLNKAREKREPIIHIQHISLRPNATFFLPDTRVSRFTLCWRRCRMRSWCRSTIPTLFGRRAFSMSCGADRSRVCSSADDDPHVHRHDRPGCIGLGFQCVVVGEATATRDLTHGNITVPAAHVQAAFLAGLSGLFAKVI